MSEQATATQAPGTDPVLAGQRIRQAREQAGLHVVALAAALKVPVHKLEALETGRLEQLPDATFARALASSVCRHLKIDPTDILAALPQVTQSKLGDAHPLNTPFRSPRDAAPASAAGRAVRGPVAAALALLVGAALVWWWVPQPQERESATTTSEPGTPLGGVTSVREEAASVATPAPGAPASEPVDAAPAVPAPASAVPASVSPALAGSAASASAPATAASATGATPTPPAVAAPATAPSAAPAADTTSGWLVVQASADTWVEVRAGSRLVAQRLIKSGERLALNEAGPLSLVIGNAGSTQVLVRGQALDLASLSRNNVARLEVK